FGRALAERLDLLPEPLPFAAFALGQFVERRATQVGEILVLLPVLHPFAYRRAGLVGLLLHQPTVCVQVGPQPLQGLAAEAVTLLGIALNRILPLATACQCCGARRLVTRLTFQILSQFRVSPESVSKETNGGPV